jgi:ABC-type sugar transport system permease subunit
MDQRATFSNLWLAGALIAPQLLLVFLFFYWPASQAVYWAFTTQPPFGGTNDWVGLQNFQQIFTDRVYWNSVIVSIIFAFFSTSLSIGMALLFALFVDRQLKGYKAYRFIYFWPYAIAAPAVGLAFRFIFAPDAGFVSAINKISPNLWNPAFNGTDAMILIVLANSWKMMAYNFIFFLAGLQAIPRALIEAAAMDGSSVLRRAREALGPASPAERRVLVVFVAVACAWILRELVLVKIPGLERLSDMGIAIAGALALFLLPSGDPQRPRLLDWSSAERIPWGIVILFGGGLSIAGAMDSTGLSDWLGLAMQGLQGYEPLVILVALLLITLIATEMMSNVATLTAMLPIVAALAVALGINPLLLVFPVTLTASLGFMLPIATAPNAIAFATGLPSLRTMLWRGFFLNVAGIAAIMAVNALLAETVLG